MRPSNMLVDPETLHVTAVLDFEFTNAMPTQLTYDSPWWQLLSGPELWLDRCAMKDFLARDESWAQIRAVPASVRASEWKRKQHSGESNPVDCLFLLVCGNRGRLGVSGSIMQRGRALRWIIVYWAALRDSSAEDQVLDQTPEGMESFTQMKMVQLRA
jgi:hypothetical protein